MEINETLLDIKNLQTVFHTSDGDLRAVDGIDLTIGRGEAVGLVGESGCGKSITSLSIMRLIPQPPGEIRAEQIRFKGRDLLELSQTGMRQIRGKELAMVFQEPMTSLNPVFTIGDQISEVLELHRGYRGKAAREKTMELLNMVNIPFPQKRMHDYPHQFSGGMRQRVMIAMALAGEPDLLIADEPTTALDVTIQAQILDLLRELQSKLGMAVLLITHDLGIVADLVKRVLVMYAGLIVEDAPVSDLFTQPLHPYTQGLLESLPRLDRQLERLKVIPGVVPNPLNLPKGCRFHPRCPKQTDICRTLEPPFIHCNSQKVRCWLYQEEKNQ